MDYIILHNENRRSNRARAKPPNQQRALGFKIPKKSTADPATPEQAGGRYYALTWSPALTGGWVVERTWGPLYNHRLQRKANFADDRAAAEVLVIQHLRRRLRHGYTIQDATPAGYTLAEQTIAKAIV